ncbi:hypothetical protein [Proteus hauseri]|uniref:hypothetical protein n=1 Tax=Proteus hauseri TaxID=183417 RepID=UPI0010095D5E|nr:hypothetical protein [Proteus hauseri]QAV24591.1 hypothetical protein PH4a_15110 [Proteus hauseri]
MKKTHKQTLLSLLLLLIILAFGSFYWLKLPYSFSYQRQIATDFLNNINNKQFEQAFELTQKNMYTGKTLEAFKEKVFREIRGSNYTFAYNFPNQTNGNRLRRWFNGSEIEMKDVNLEFKGASDLRITLRHIGDNKWKIYYMTSHAG